MIPSAVKAQNYALHRLYPPLNSFLVVLSRRQRQYHRARETAPLAAKQVLLAWHRNATNGMVCAAARRSRTVPEASRASNVRRFICLPYQGAAGVGKGRDPLGACRCCARHSHAGTQSCACTPRLATRASSCWST